MSRRLYPFALLCAVHGCGGVQKAPPVTAHVALTPAQIAERAIPSVALIRLPGGGVGSGFIVGADGRIATNLHVIRNAKSATIVLSDGREFTDVQVLATDDDHDLALLQIGARNLPSLTLGDSAAVKPGSHVVAIGNPMGLGNTVSDGLVSAVRQLAPGVDVLQVSAPISPGSSGGPLLDEEGRVIGISTLIVNKGQNLNFGVGINALKALLLGPTHGVTLAVAKGDATNGGNMSDIHREVPQHDLSLLDGCPAPHLESVLKRIAGAISVGAPLYNDGNHEACFRIYAAAARDIERSSPAACVAPAKALIAGVHRADGLASFTAKAWAMRDAFDGLIEVITRKGIGVVAAPKPRGPVREVPTHPLSLLASCSPDDLAKIEKSIGDAIELGAPLYNDGNHEACFRIYEGTALDLDRLHGCAGPRRALMDGVRKAKGQSDYTSKAWSMRDAFDGVIDVIERRARAN